jgi:D,D-heptose 1,7-bisphosphate phosphatase
VSSDGLTARTATLRQCAILAGGLATRLGPLTATTPKPLLPCGDRPFLAWLLRELCRFGIERVLLLTGHLADSVAASVADLADRLPRRLEITLSTEPHPAGTAGALWHARERLEERFLLLNGDSLLDGNLAALLADAAADDPASVPGRLALAEVADTARYGVVDLDGDRVTGFRDRPAEGGGRGWISAGIYALDRRMLDIVPPHGSLERDVLPLLAARGALRATKLPGWFIDIGIPADLARAQAELPARLHRRALFLDRDGVLNHDLGYVGSWARFRWTDGAQAAVRAASAAGWHVFVVTNQSGVARGFYDEDAVAGLHDWMADELRRAGGTIDDVRYCPHHPQAPLPAYRRACACRKPAAGMLLDLLRAWQLDPAASVLVGDQPTDLAAAAAAGIRGVHFAGGDLAATVRPLLATEGPLPDRPHAP